MATDPFAPTACPCGGVPAGASYDACCGPLLRGTRQAATAEQLMRSRYTAFAVGDGDHLFRTWHPRTRPDDVSPSRGTAWTGLEVGDAVGGGPDDAEGEVAFTARWRAGDGSEGALVERSRFARRAGRWVYVDGS